MDDFQRVAVQYMGNEYSKEAEGLANDIRLAKAWTIVELLSKFASNFDQNKHADILARLQKELPAWLQQVQGTRYAV